MDMTTPCVVCFLTGISGLLAMAIVGCIQQRRSLLRIELQTEISLLPTYEQADCFVLHDF